MMGISAGQTKLSCQPPGTALRKMCVLDALLWQIAVLKLVCFRSISCCWHLSLWIPGFPDLGNNVNMTKIIQEGSIKPPCVYRHLAVNKGLRSFTRWAVAEMASLGKGKYYWFSQGLSSHKSRIRRQYQHSSWGMRSLEGLKRKGRGGKARGRMCLFFHNARLRKIPKKAQLL